jgi:hypothetical protein
MPARRLPQSVLGFQKAMDDGKNKSTGSPEEAISSDTIDRLDIVQPEYNGKVLAMNVALQDQLNTTALEQAAFNVCRMYTSHFFQVLNLGIARGIYPASARTFFGIDANDDKVPVLTKENDVTHWAQTVVSGNAARITAGGAAMANPTAVEVGTKLTDYLAKHNTQSEKKDTYDNAQQAVAVMYDTVKQLVVDMWDEVEFYFRHEPDEPSKRRKCREWGVVYVSDKKGKIIGSVSDIDTGLTLAGVTVKIIETDESTLTLETGKYELVTTLVGTGTLEFTLAGYIPVTVEVDLSEGGTLTQAAQMKAV